MKLMKLLLLVVGLGSCGGHLPGPLDIPSVIGGEVEDAAYRARRKKVKAHVLEHLDALRAGNEEAINNAILFAKVKKEHRAKVMAELKDPRSPALDPAERIAGLAMEWYTNTFPGTKEDKTYHGFQYNEAFEMIHNDAKARPGIYYKVIKSGQGEALDELLTNLKLNDPQKKGFIANLHGHYDDFYVDSIVVLLMVTS